MSPFVWNGTDLIAAIKSAGYSLVQVEAKISPSFEVDLIAWGMTDEGEFGPIMSVEVKGANNALLRDRALKQLSRISQIVGTQINLALAGGTLYQADVSFTALHEINYIPQARREDFIITDKSMVQTLLEHKIWSRSNTLRGNQTNAVNLAAYELLEDMQVSTPGRVKGLVDRGEVNGEIFIDAWIGACMKLNPRSSSESFTDPSLARVMATLAGDIPDDSVIWDPFAGHGGSLLAGFQAAKAHGSAVKLGGLEINQEVARNASKLLSLAGLKVKIEVKDAFQSQQVEAATILSVPPLGIRLLQPYETKFGTTNEGDIAAIVQICESLKSGGRAVFLTTRSWTARGNMSARLRQWLSQNFHVVALIGLPPILSGTSLAPLLVVIDRNEPGPSLVADLGADWMDQLSSDSEIQKSIPTRSQ